ncbi:hypothetical protein JZ751_016836, partial [Albula glossodonta]
KCHAFDKGSRRPNAMQSSISAMCFLREALPEDYRDSSFAYRQDELDIDVKLSRLCEQDKVVRTQEHKLQQLYREKVFRAPPQSVHICEHTLETALLSASQEIEMSAGDQLALQSSLERSWREYDRLEADVTLIRNNLLEQLEALGAPQEERSVPPRPPLPQYYDIIELPPAVPPLPGSVQQAVGHTLPSRPEDRKHGQRNGSHSVSHI